MSLEQAESKIERAKHHIDDLDRVWREYASGSSHGLAIVQNAEGTRRTLRIVTNPPIPPAIASIIGDAVHNLRTVLDLATWEIVAPFGPKRPKSVQFPFVADKDRFEEALTSREIRRAGNKIVGAFRDLEPYPKGKGEQLWKFDALDIADKHKLLIPSIAALSIDMLAIRAIDPSAPNVAFKGVTMIPNELGDLPVNWAVGPEQGGPLNSKAVVKATLEMAFARGQVFEDQLCVLQLRTIADDVAKAIVFLKTAMV